MGGSMGSSVVRNLGFVGFAVTILFFSAAGYSDPGNETENSEALKKLGPTIFQSVVDAVESRPISKAELVAEGRLTLTSATPLTTSNVTAATTVYFTPYHGNKIALYSGTVWQLLTFTEKSVAVPPTTVTPFDIFAYNNSGTVTLETVNWTNDTTRATALTLQDGVYVKTGATTRRYLGTGRTTSVSGQTEDSKTKRFLWNFYNRLKRPLVVLDATGSWSYGTATWRSARGSTANRVEVVVGVAESVLNLRVMGSGTGAVGEEFSVGIGTDSTTAYDTDIRGMYGIADAASPAVAPAHATLDTIPSVGYHYYQWLEISPQGGTVTFYGTTWGVAGLNGVIDG